MSTPDQLQRMTSGSGDDKSLDFDDDVASSSSSSDDAAAAAIQAAAVQALRNNKRVIGSRDYRSLEELRSDSVISHGASQTLQQQCWLGGSSSQEDEVTTAVVAAPRTVMSPRQSLVPTAAPPCCIATIIDDLQWSLHELGYHTTMPRLEQQALTLHGALTRRNDQSYHGITHVLEIAAGALPLQLLAAWTRNLVQHYVQDYSDDMVTTLHELGIGHVFVPDEIVDNPNKNDRHRPVVAPRQLAQLDDPRDRAVAVLFGLNAAAEGGGPTLRHVANVALDVFLSALAAGRLLDVLTLTHVVQLAAVLECTVPFRPAHTLDALHDRLVHVNRDFQLGLSPQDIINTIQLGVDLANRNLGNMLSDQLAVFLDHTLSLLPEHNVQLRYTTVHHLGDYYAAMYKMVNFLQHLQAGTTINSTVVATTTEAAGGIRTTPERVVVAMYQQFRGVPDDHEMAHFTSQLQRNLPRAVTYMQTRLLAVAVLSALAIVTGGNDRPTSFFFGDIPTFHSDCEKLGQALHDDTDMAPVADDVDAAICDILKGQRHYSTLVDSGFDNSRAFVSAFLYEQLGQRRMQVVLETIGPVMNATRAWNLLRALPRQVVRPLAVELGRFTVSRMAALHQILDQLSQTTDTNITMADRHDGHVDRTGTSCPVVR